MPEDTSKLLQIPLVNNRFPTLGFGLSWDATVSKSETEEAIALHSQGMSGPERIEEGNPFFVAPREDLNSFVDLQAIAIGLRAQAGFVDYVDGSRLNALDGGLAHTGDDNAGFGNGWDEMCTVGLPFLPDDVEAVGLFVHCRSSHMLSDAANAKYALFSMRDQVPIVDGDLQDAFTTRLVGMVRRSQGDFVVQPIDFSFNAVSLDDALSTLAKYW